MTKVGIIGTAGRQDDAFKLKRGDFGRMCNIVTELICIKMDLSSVTLYSGGAAWADHVAVRIFKQLHGCQLKLFLPCKFDTHLEQYIDTGIRDYKTNPGGTSNMYHRKFSATEDFNSLAELASALRNDQNSMMCQHTVGNGFHTRNLEVAQADIMICLTFGQGAKLKDGGTADTYSKYVKRCNKQKKKIVSYHVDLNSWTIYTPAII